MATALKLCVQSITVSYYLKDNENTLTDSVSRVTTRDRLFSTMAVKLLLSAKRTLTSRRQGDPRVTEAGRLGTGSSVFQRNDNEIR